MILTVNSKEYSDITDRFLNSIQETKHTGDVKVVNSKIDKAEFGTKAFQEITFEKIKIILDTLKQMSPYSVLLYADADVLFFKDPDYFIEHLGSYDIKFQREPNNTACAGFMVMMNSPKIQKMFKEVLRKKYKCSNDQIALNVYGLDEIRDLRWTFFSDLEVFSYGLAKGGKVWNGEEFDISKCYAFHANYTIGLDNKRKLLDYVSNYGKN